MREPVKLHMIPLEGEGSRLPTTEDYPIIIFSETKGFCISNIEFVDSGNGVKAGYSHWASLNLTDKGKAAHSDWLDPEATEKFVASGKNELIVMYNPVLADSEEYVGHAYEIAQTDGFIQSDMFKNLGFTKWQRFYVVFSKK